MGSLDKEVGFESDGFTFTDILRRADPLPETVLEVVVGVLDLPLCLSSFFILLHLGFEEYYSGHLYSP